MKYFELGGWILACAVLAQAASGATLRQEQGSCIIDCDLTDEPLVTPPTFAPFAPPITVLTPPVPGFGAPMDAPNDSIISVPTASEFFSDDSPLPGPDTDVDELFETSPILNLPEVEE